MAWIRNKQNPNKRCAVYFVFDARDQLLYIGSSTNPFSRMALHFDQWKKRNWSSEPATIKIEWFSNVKVARTIEKVEIMKRRPPYNKMHNVVLLKYIKKPRFKAYKIPYKKRKRWYFVDRLPIPGEEYIPLPLPSNDKTPLIELDDISPTLEYKPSLLSLALRLHLKKP